MQVMLDIRMVTANMSQRLPGVLRAVVRFPIMGMAQQIQLQWTMLHKQS